MIVYGLARCSQLKIYNFRRPSWTQSPPRRCAAALHLDASGAEAFLDDDRARGHHGEL